MKLTGYSTDDTRHSYPLDPNPTQAEPGTQEKVKVMIERRKKGYAIFHPLDNLFHSERKENNAVRLLVGGVRETNRKGVRWDRQTSRHYKEKSKGGWEGYY